MRKTVFLLCLVFSSLPVCAQQSVAEAAAQAKAPHALPADAPTRDQVLTLLDLMQARKTMIAAMDNLKQIMKDSAEQSFRERVPNPTAKQLDALHGIYDDIVDIPLDEMMNAIISIYQRHLTKSDVTGLITFYSSSVGQKVLREQSAMVRESMEATAAGQQRKMESLMAKLELRVQKLALEEQNKNAPEKK